MELHNITQVNNYKLLIYRILKKNNHYLVIKML